MKVACFVLDAMYRILAIGPHTSTEVEGEGEPDTRYLTEFEEAGGTCTASLHMALCNHGACRRAARCQAL